MPNFLVAFDISNDEKRINLTERLRYWNGVRVSESTFYLQGLNTDTVTLRDYFSQQFHIFGADNIFVSETVDWASMNAIETPRDAAGYVPPPVRLPAPQAGFSPSLARLLSSSH